ncbi:ead/Ea22-like family protein [Salmonella enterica subsp. enterica]|uniref:Ead/Ea22-like family protein n=2 Tax=Salmonella enterica TaxID=28901 RepID=A0A5U6CRZ8_SALER|nr:ead/Ea22-like family protein [Salmonella enterica]ECV0669684.1 ead/Ea22-like family protein [Salmonella enterica subsp. enterica serovar Altona]HEB2603218.1 ead/Ea22-like family protein [Salmonella enterica subsp. enterica]EAW8543629.1 ead/Ea22-like family protein [Salmonella enterica]EAZ2540192.1 ead/Ea22-like family protein [Salmonella enterica]EBA6721318.1 ead/Ea22-like family protein [Salmonella enterica]
MSNINKQALREVAEKATPGNWRHASSRFNGITVTPFSLCDEEVMLAHAVEKRDAEFIAAANPATMLALLDELETAKKRIAELEAEPVSQAYNLPELIEGMEVSIDVSTCDADLGNRYFGTVTEALELDTAKNGYILLVQDAEPNFDVNGNSSATPDGWVMVPKELTPEMMRAVQIRSELGGYATSNLSGAYNMFSEFWNVAVSAAPKVDYL